MDEIQLKYKRSLDCPQCASTKTSLNKALNKMNCEKCGYEWTPRTDKPKECPECKTRLKHKKDLKVNQ